MKIATKIFFILLYTTQSFAMFGEERDEIMKINKHIFSYKMKENFIGRIQEYLFEPQDKESYPKKMLSLSSNGFLENKEADKFFIKLEPIKTNLLEKLLTKKIREISSGKDISTEKKSSFIASFKDFLKDCNSAEKRFLYFCLKD